MIWIRLIAAGAVLSVVGCAGNDCTEIPGSKQGAGFCHIPDDGQAGKPAQRPDAGMRWPVAGQVPVGRPAGAGGSGGSGGAAGRDPAQMVSGCGNGIQELGEGCDGASCPVECDTGNACYVGALTGSSETCDAKCKLTEIVACKSGDGCCPNSCSHETDTDCSSTCGDGKLDPDETCEAGTSKPCPESCDDGDVCTTDVTTGTGMQCSAACAHMALLASKAKDGCCPTGANITVDPDCKAECGDGVISAGETCDTASYTGCPSSCDDGDGCTKDSLTGTADKCNVRCTHEPIEGNENDDGCCMTGATEDEDNDCKIECYDAADCDGESECKAATCTSNKCGARAKTGDCDGGNGTCQVDGTCKAKARCGDGKVDPGEKCDGNCPACDDKNPCTMDSATGTADACSLVCSHAKVAAGSNCGGSNRCDAAGACKAPACGDGTVDSGELCDGNCPAVCPMSTAECSTNTLKGSASSCSAQCETVQSEMGLVCGTGNKQARGACTGTATGCMFNNWYRPCYNDGGCFGSLFCLDYQCKMKCSSDAECGAPAVGARGRCVSGSCERRCNADNECAPGQICQTPGNNGMCRPKPCNVSGSDCPQGMQCLNSNGGPFMCLP